MARFIVTIQWGKGFHYINGGMHAMGSAEYETAKSAAQGVAARWRGRIKRGARPTVRVWELRDEFPYVGKESK